MDDYRVPTDEQETVIQFDRNGTVCHVYTTDSTVMTKLDKKYKRIKHDYINGKPIAAYYEFDKKLIMFRSKRARITLTEEQRDKKRKLIKRNCARSKK